MKKIMIFSIILMPLIVLCIMFLSGTIVNRSTYLYVEYIEFVNDNIILEKPFQEDAVGSVEVNVFPRLANNKEVEFWSNDENIVTVDENGNILGHYFGETYIYAKSKEDETKQASCKVVVISETVHEVWAKNPVEKMYVGTSHNLNIKYMPLSALNADFNITSSNESVLEALPNGTLNAKSKGTSTVTIALKSNPLVNYSFDVVVKVKVDSAYIEDQSPVVSGKINFDFPKVNLVPSSADEIITYSSSDDNIATVDQNGKITFLQAGTVEISALVDDVNITIKKQYTSTFGYFTNVSFLSQNEKVLNYEDWQVENPTFLWSAFPSDADNTNLSFESSNPNVIAIENGQFKVVGGGETTLKIVAKSSKTTSINATWVVTVNRKIESISLNLANFLYTTNQQIELGTSFLPTDATEEIMFSVSDSSLAKVENNKLIFSASVVLNKYGKVSVTAYTGKVSKTITVVYLDANIQQISIDNQDEFNFTLPTTGNSPFTFAFVSEATNLTDVNLTVKSGVQVVSQNGCIFTLTDKGVCTIDAVFSGENETTKIITINARRIVEKIYDVKINALWNDLPAKSYAYGDTIYSSSAKFGFEYKLYPENTSISCATAQIVGDSASIVDNYVVFAKAGKVTLVLSADDITLNIELESTNLHPDDNTIVQDKIDLEKGQSVSIFDYISISPQNASNSFVSFSTHNCQISLSDGGVITALCGGTALINVMIETTTQNIQKQIVVNVTESAKNVSVVGNEYIYSLTKNLSVADKFKVLPETANINTDLTFEVEEKNVAQIDDFGTLTFTCVGKCVVVAKLGSLDVAKISVVYAPESSDYILLDGNENNYTVIVGAKVVISLPESVLNGAKYNQNFVVNSGNAQISNGIFITILNDSTISFNNVNYVFDSVENIESVSLLPNASDVDLGTNKYITGLISLTLQGQFVGVDKKYVNANYSVNNSNVASVDASKLTFKQAGEIVVTYTVTYKTNVLGAESITKSVSVTIESTFGHISKIVAVGDGEYQHTIDDVTLENNTIDISEYVCVYPTQITPNANNIKLSLDNLQLASVNGLNLTFQKGGNLEVEVQFNSLQGFVKGASLKFEIKRNATAIYLDGNEIKDGDVITAHKSTIYVNPTFYPQDANINKEITWIVLENDQVAEVDYAKSKIVFKKFDQTIKVKFTLGQGEFAKEFVVYFKTTTITFEVDIESENYVVPMKEPFSFVSSSGEIENLVVNFGELTDYVTQMQDDVYKINQSVVGQITVSYGTITKTRQLIATTDFQDISDVNLYDVDMNSNYTEIATTKNQLSLTTASKQISVLYTIPVGYDKYGNLIDYVITSESDCVTINNNDIVFNSEGTAKIVVSVTYEDAYTENSISYNFLVCSTFEKATSFEISNKTYSFIYDDMQESEKTIDVLSSVTRKTPLYGNVVSPTIGTITGSSVKVVDNKIQVCGSGVSEVEICFGKATEKITITIDKYIDEINFVENNQVVSQVATKSNTYTLDYTIVSLDENYTSTLNSVTFTALGDCSVDGNVVTFNKIDTKYEITVSANMGSASKKLIIVYVSEDVNIIKATASLSDIEIKKDVINIFDFRFDANVVSIGSLGANVEFVDSTIQTFKGLCGTQGSLRFSNNQEVSYVVTEEVTSLKFKDGAIESGFLTAMGSKNDNKPIDLVEAYGVTIEPETARDSEGNFTVEYVVNDETTAYVENEKLYFIKQGQVTISFVIAGKCFEQRTIKSTLGYAEKIEFADSLVNPLTFEFSSGQYNLPSKFYTVTPADAYLENVVSSTSNSEVFEINQNAIVFVGGGNAEFVLTYNTSADNTASIKQQVKVINRATGINFYDGETRVGYMVKNFSPKSTMFLNCEVLSQGKMSLSNLYFTSSNTNVATITQKIEGFAGNNTTKLGDVILTFVGDGVTTITVKIQDKTNGESDFDVVATLTIVNGKDYNIKTITDNTELVFESLDGMTDNMQQCVLYPMPNTYVTEFEFGYLDENQIVTVSTLGEIVEKKGGETQIFVKEKNASGEDVWNKTVTIYIHKSTQVELDKTSVYTAKTSCTFEVAKTPIDSLVRKQIVVKFNGENDEQIARFEDNYSKVVFTSAGTVTVVVQVLYGQVVENEKTLKITSTFGKVDRFALDMYQCEMYTSDSPITFTAINIEPSDYCGDFKFEGVSEEFYTIQTISGTQFKISGKKAFNGNLVVKFDGTEGVSQTISITIKQYAESITLYYAHSQAPSEIKTFYNVIELSAVVGPDDATNKNVDWNLQNVNLGGADDGFVSIENGRVTFTEGYYGSVTVVAKTTDRVNASENKQVSVVVNYIEDISTFILTYNNKELTDGEEIFINWSVQTVNLGIKIGLDNFDNYGGFSGISLNQTNKSTITIANKTVQIKTVYNENARAFEDSIQVSYTGKNSITKTVKVLRDGISKIDFGDLDNTQDKDYGLQEMRVFGNRSYYDLGVDDTNKIKNYYRMTINTYHGDKVVDNSLCSKLKWETTNNLVAVEIGNGYADIIFDEKFSACDFDTIYENDFDKIKNYQVTVTLTNTTGSVYYEYTFIVVNGVNVFDGDGYINGGSSIVLQKSLGHTDQQDLIYAGTYAQFNATTSAQTNKTYLFGNGYLINFAARNDDETAQKEDSYKSYDNIQVSIPYMTNIQIQGANRGSTNSSVPYSTFHMELTDVKKMAYTKVYYMYRAIENAGANTTAYIKNCLFRSFQSSGIILSDSKATGKSLYLENIIMFDVGQRAIEIQVGTAYVKGFLDVYNFQSQDALKNLSDITIGSWHIGGSTLAKEIISVASKNGMVIKHNNTEYVNVVGISTKSQDIQMLYWENGEYVYKTDGSQAESAPGLKRINGSKYSINYCAWAYESYLNSDNTVKDGAYLTYDNEFNSDGTLNETYMISTSVKLKRTYVA